MIAEDLQYFVCFIFFQNKTPAIIAIFNNVVTLLCMRRYLLKAKILNIKLFKMK